MITVNVLDVVGYGNEHVVYYYVSQITVRYIVIHRVLFFFSNTYVLYTIRKGFWCILSITFVCPPVWPYVCESVRPSARLLTLSVGYFLHLWGCYMYDTKENKKCYLSMILFLKIFN